MKNKLNLPVVHHHPKPNIIANWREYNKNVIPYHSFIEYPSVKIEFDNIEEILQILEEVKTNCVFVDGSGDSLIIPAYYQNLIDWLLTKFKGTVLDYSYGKEFEFVTLAIKNGLNGQIVELGHSIFGLDGTAYEMLEKALKNPNQAIVDWRDLYKKSMMPI